MKRGDTDFVQSGDISICKWLDKGKKPVHVISNMHRGKQQIHVLRTNSTGTRDLVKTYESVSDYNKFMGGVDHFDQLLSAYSIGWKSRRWWMPIFYYLLDCAIVNSYIYYKQDMKKKKQKHIMSHLQFRLKLAEQLIANFSSRDRKFHSTTKKCSSKFENVGDHVPVLGTYRRCGHCSTKQKQKRSNLLCKACDIALCKGCFTASHVKE